MVGVKKSGLWIKALVFQGSQGAYGGSWGVCPSGKVSLCHARHMSGFAYVSITIGKIYAVCSHCAPEAPSTFIAKHSTFLSKMYVYDFITFIGEVNITFDVYCQLHSPHCALFHTISCNLLILLRFIYLSCWECLAYPLQYMMVTGRRNIPGGRHG